LGRCADLSARAQQTPLAHRRAQSHWVRTSAGVARARLRDGDAGVAAGAAPSAGLSG